MRDFRFSMRFSGVFVRLVWADLSLSPCLLRAYYSVVRLTPVDFGVSAMPFFSWGPVLLLGVLVYLVLVSRILSLED